MISGTTDIGNHCDDCTTNIALPFAFSFYGTSFTSANVSSNGNVQFTSSGIDNVNTCLPYASFNNAIFGHWGDLLTSGTGRGVFTSTSGTAPNRIFNIEWRTNYNSGGVANFEVRLYEASWDWNIVYGRVDHHGDSARGHRLAHG